MRNLEVIEKDLAAAREALSSVEGTPAEVYSRIVGYYRSVRNWNRGKREEYGERRLYRITDGLVTASSNAVSPQGETRMVLFTRKACPACPPAKAAAEAAAEALDIPVELVNTDSPEGMDTAKRYNVMSTPTAILLSPENRELGRAWDAQTIIVLARVPAQLPIAV